ncbi:ATP-dependent nuclease [Arthrobacter pullicola]
MLKSLTLTRYKGFKTYSIQFKNGALLVGPNNAGKSTIIEATRLAYAATKIAARVGPKDVYYDKNKTVMGYPLARIPESGFNNENVQFEFEEELTRIGLTYTSGATVNIVWPIDEAPFFWLEHKGSHVVNAAAAKKLISTVGIVPTLSPVEKNEKTVSEAHLRTHVETKLFSRHFRNHLYATKISSDTDFALLISFLLEHTEELSSLQITTSIRDGGTWLNLYYLDAVSRTEKEIVWAGDGLQIWLQVLFHVWRTRESETIILDEPDVFLHPDLQRRLVRVLEASGRQVILSSHASEVASESDAARLTWIERSANKARRISDSSEMESVSSGLGSSFNLSMARALKAKVALFVEGDDMKLIRIIAERLGCRHVASESGLAVIGIGGYSHWPGVESFGWLKQHFLGNAVSVRLILDRDYRTDSESTELIQKVSRFGVSAHIWRRKEIESYLLEPVLIAKVTKLEISVVCNTLMEICDGMKNEIQGQYTKHYVAELDSKLDESTKYSKAFSAFESDWADLSGRIVMAPAKSVINGWNSHTNANKLPGITARKLAAMVSEDTLDWEFVELMREIEMELSDN